MNFFRVTLFIFLLTSCSKKKDLQGYWYGEHKYESGRNPALIKFENNAFIEFFNSFQDTTVYKSYGNKIYFNNRFNEKRELKIKLKDHQLSIYESDSLMIILKRRASDNFIFDYLNDKDLIIDLPSGKGHERTLGQFAYLKRPLYLTYKLNKLTANFLDTSVTVNSDYHKFLFSKLVSMDAIGAYSRMNKISLIADKDLKMSDINLLTMQLRIFGFSQIRYLLKPASYERENTFDFRLKELTDKEFDTYHINDSLRIPAPPSYFEYIVESKNKLRLIEVDGYTIKHNDRELTENDFLKLLMPQMTADSDLNFAYYMTEESTYQHFIHFNDIVLNAIYAIRDNYLMNKYGLKYTKTNGFGSEKNKEAQTKHPLKLYQLNMDEFKKLKHSL